MPRVVFGYHPVESALRRHGREVRAVFVTGRGRADKIRALADEAQVAVQSVAPAELDGLCEGAGHQGVAALLGDYPYRELEDLLEGQDAAPLLLFLDGVQDPQNLGSMFRSALLLGATGLVIPQDRAAGVTPAVVRVSAGATEHLPCARVTNLARALHQAKDAGLWVAGAVAEGGDDPAAMDLTGPLALVLGSEGKGIRRGVLKACDLKITLPTTASPVDSLNVANAAAVLLYEVSRQRRAADG